MNCLSKKYGVKCEGEEAPVRNAEYLHRTLLYYCNIPMYLVDRRFVCVDAADLWQLN